jgi:hypothetical protein
MRRGRAIAGFYSPTRVASVGRADGASPARIPGHDQVSNLVGRYR